MRIAIIRLSATPLVSSTATGVFGGAEVRALTFAQGLANQTDHDVQMIVQANSTRAIPSRGRLEFHALRSRRGAGRSGKWRGLWRLPLEQGHRLTRSLLRRATGQPDVRWEFCRLPADVLCSFGLHDPTATVVRSARRAGKSSVVFLTSDEDTQQALAPAAATDRYRRWHRYAIDHADLVVAQTECQRDRIQRAGRPVVLIRNPIETKLAEDRLVPMVCRQHVLWVGRADTDCKRADLCWQLASQCPDVPFVAVMNPQDPRLTQRLISQAPANVRVLQRVSWQSSDALFRNALALVNTSESEGFPNAFLQAAKYGVPVLSRRVNPDQVLTRFGFGFVANDDLSRLAAMVRQISAGPQRFSLVSRAARQYVERYHALDQRIAELQAALARFETLAGRRRAA